jgi:hypothetical protein
MYGVTDWLEKLGLSEYAQRFADNAIDLSVLPDLTDQDLEKIGVLLGHRHAAGTCSHGLPLGHLEVAGQFVKENQHRLVAEHGDPFVDSRRLRTAPPKRGHDVTTFKLFSDVAPQQRLRVLVAVENHDLGRAKVRAGRELRRYLTPQGGVGCEQPKSDQAMGLTSTHGLGQIEGAVVALTRKSVEPASNQEVQPCREVIAPEERASIDLSRGKIFNLGNLFDETIAGHDSAGYAELVDSCYGHL